MKGRFALVLKRRRNMPRMRKWYPRASSLFPRTPGSPGSLRTHSKRSLWTRPIMPQRRRTGRSWIILPVQNVSSDLQQHRSVGIMSDCPACLMISSFHVTSGGALPISIFHASAVRRSGLPIPWIILKRQMEITAHPRLKSCFLVRM